MKKHFYFFPVALLLILFNTTGKAQIAACDSLIGNTQTIGNLPNGDYKVVVTDALGCTQTDNVTVYTENDLSIYAYAVQQNACNTSYSGIATVSASGGGPFTYHWSNGQNTADASVLSNGTYTVTVTNTNNCSQTASVTILNENDLSIYAYAVQQNACNTSYSGIATVSASGGSPFTYHWSNGQNTPDASVLSNGTYTVTVTNANNCSQTASVTILNENDLSIYAYAVQQNACNTSYAGIATVSASGGSPYTYHWSNGQNTPDASVLSNGTYTVTVTNANNCSQTASVTIVNENDLSIYAYVVQQNACNTSYAGMATVSASGSSPFTYHWSNGQNTPDASVLSNGAYTVTVTNANNCSQTASVTILNENDLNIYAYVVQHNACNTAYSGSATVSASGGSPFTYHWSNGQNTADASVLINGTYTVTVTNANTCSLTASVTIITENDLNLYAYATQQNACNTTNAGTATVSVSGTSPYTYQWYKVVGAQQPVIIAFNHVLTATQGVSYQWYRNDTVIAGANGQTYSVTVSGSYTVLVTYGNGCSSLSNPVVESISTDIQEAAVGAFRIFPNPATDLLIIEGAGNELNMLSAEIYDLTGKLLLRQTGSDRVNISRLATGSYLIRLSRNGYSHNSAFVKQ